jgi:hypothetical protein
MTATSDPFKDSVPPLLHPPPFPRPLFTMFAPAGILISYRVMCGRYPRTTSEEELARLYHIPIPKQTDLPISYNIARSQKVLTIRFNPETRAQSLDALQWGLIPYWAKDPKVAYRTINVRTETVDKAPRIGKLSRNGAA